MSTERMRFGEFIREKRMADRREITLREMSAALGISLSLLSDIEQGRRSPFDSDKIKLFCSYLHLASEDETLMYDLAARERDRVSDDISDYIMNSNIGDMARTALRMSKSGIGEEEDWKRFIRELERKRQSHDPV